MDRYYIYSNDDARIKEEIDKDGDWVHYEDAAARIAELEAEIVERRKDYSACIRDQDARIAELEALLAAMTAERDSESHWAKHYSDKVTELEQQLAAKQRIIDSYRRMI